MKQTFTTIYKKKKIEMEKSGKSLIVYLLGFVFA